MGVCPENEPDLVNRDPNGINSHIKVKYCCMPVGWGLKQLHPGAITVGHPGKSTVCGGASNLPGYKKGLLPGLAGFQ